MATQQGIISYRLLDDKGAVKSFAEYVTFDNATATLSSIAAAISAAVSTVDAITDAQIVSVSFQMFYALPGGIKAAPVADCDVEETGLYTFVTSAPGGKVYSEDVPAIAPAVVTGNELITDTGDGAAFVTYVTGTGGTLRNTDNKWAYTLNTIKRGLKKFRK